MQFSIPLALSFGVGVVFASLETGSRPCYADNCARAVTGTRRGLSHPVTASVDCVSYFVGGTVTPPAVTVTVTTVFEIGAKKQVDSTSIFALPTYATACTDDYAYFSACSCFGAISAQTFSTAPVPTTTVYVSVNATSSAGGASSSSAASSSATLSSLSSTSRSVTRGDSTNSHTAHRSSSVPTLPTTHPNSTNSHTVHRSSSAYTLPTTRANETNSHFTHGSSFAPTLSVTRANETNSHFTHGSSSAPTLSTTRANETNSHTAHRSSSASTLSTIQVSSTTSVSVHSTTSARNNSTSIVPSPSTTSGIYTNATSTTSSSASSCTGDISSDPNNCGACGTVCPSGACESGVCTDASCDAKVCGEFLNCQNNSNCFCFSSTNPGPNNGFCGQNAVCSGLTACADDSDCEVEGSTGNVCAINTCCPKPSDAQPGICLQGQCANPAKKLMMMARALNSRAGTAAF